MLHHVSSNHAGYVSQREKQCIDYQQEDKNKLEKEKSNAMLWVFSFIRNLIFFLTYYISYN